MGDVHELDGYDGVEREFAHAHADQLAGESVWLFSSGPLGLSPPTAGGHFP